MIDVEVSALGRAQYMTEISRWLDSNMPNPPIDEPQRWTLGYNSEQTRIGIRFYNEEDAILFNLRWS
ncbi:MAG TPA: hypothetical protein VFM18_18245 [Methanosarcina sp.]|nr:hypothetical protein [Methanosarcina sp.]